MKKIFLSIFVAVVALITLASCNTTAATLTSIELDTSAAKVAYLIGEDLDMSGLKITAHYSNETTKALEVSECTVDSSAYDKTKVGSYEITVTYHEQSAKYSVSVAKKEVPLSSIESVLTTATNNQDIKVQGVVYAVIDNKVFIADSQNGVISIIKNDVEI